MVKAMIFKSEPILIDAGKDAELAALGYTLFPFLTESEVNKLIGYYNDFQKEEPGHFYSSSHSQNKAFRRQTSDFIKATISPLLNTYFKNYQLLGGAFVVKPAHGKGLLPPHQDWNLVDERESRSYNIWIPLTDVNFENGTVCVLPGSHRKIQSYRGPGIASLFKDIEPLVWKNLRVLPMKAGEALFYDHALLHASPVNTTDKVRLGIVCGITGEKSEIQLYFDREDKIESYKIDPDFFLEKDPSDGPDGLSFVEALPKIVNLSAEDFDQCFLGKKKRNSWFFRFFKAES